VEATLLARDTVEDAAHILEDTLDRCRQQGGGGALGRRHTLKDRWVHGWVGEQMHEFVDE
jgi:hypothetical protein